LPAKWSDSLQGTRYFFDALLLIFFVLSNVPQISLAFHEWISTAFVPIFIIHLILHWDWIVGALSRFFTKAAKGLRFRTILDVFIYGLMIFVIISGFLASEILLPLFGEFEARPVWTELHHKYSNLLMPFIGIHLAMNWDWIKSWTKRMFGQKASSG